MEWYLTRKIYGTAAAIMIPPELAEDHAAGHAVEVGVLEVRSTIILVTPGGIEAAEIVEAVMSGVAMMIITTKNGMGSLLIHKRLSTSLKHSDSVVG